MNVLKFLSDSFVDYSCEIQHYTKMFSEGDHVQFAKDMYETYEKHSRCL